MKIESIGVVIPKKKSFTIFLMASAMTIALLAAVSPCGNASQAENQESSLRARVSAFWNAMQAGNQQAAAQYVIPEDRKFFETVPIGEVRAWKLDRLEFNAERTVCQVHVAVSKHVPGFGPLMDLPFWNNWVLKNGKWLMKAANTIMTPGEQIFGQKALSKLEIKKAAKQLPLEPDPSNPRSMLIGDKAVFRFRFTNTGKTPVSVASSTSYCTCLDVAQSNREIAPGSAVLLEITLDSTALPAGAFDKTVIFNFSDGSQGIAQVITEIRATL